MIDYMHANSNTIAYFRERFLFLSANRDPIDLKLFKGKCVVYAIENIKTQKTYIGKTTNILNRSNAYIYAYRNHDEKNPSSSRPIINAMLSEGIDNFMMYPLVVTPDRDSLALTERNLIVCLMRMDPNKLYNVSIPCGRDEYKMSSFKKYSQSIATKITKSKMIAAINPDTKQMYISTGMKLFSVFVGSSKDQVKNCAKRGIRHRGFYIIYLDTDYRAEVQDRRKNNQELMLKPYKEKRPNYHNDKYEEYFYFVDLANTMIDEESDKCFTDLGYTCKFLTYPDENPESVDLYKLDSTATFFDMLNIDNNDFDDNDLD